MLERIRQAAITRATARHLRRLLRRRQRPAFRRSAYGPDLIGPPADITYQFALNGKYGDFIAARIAAQPRNRVFLDIGANIGLFSVMAARHLADGKVYSFEPNSVVYQFLQQNLHRNGCANATAFCLAVAPGAPCSIDLLIDPQHSGTTSMVQATGASLVRASTVDHRLFDAIDEPGRSYAVKIDVEGFEPQVLEALFSSTLAPRIAEVIVEIAEQTHGREHSEAVVGFLAAHSFVSAGRSSPSAHRDEAFVRATS